MFESTEWNLTEPSNEDSNKYDNLCPTVVTWTPADRASKVHYTLEVVKNIAKLKTIAIDSLSFRLR